ncbi:MAG: type II secretion system F family protein [Clostridia bacterium]|nr:type II secretion system F family protein [Clostridia bacterium]
MPDFKYRGMLKDGSRIKGIIPSQTKLEVFEKLKKSSIQPIKIEVIEPRRTKKIFERDREKLLKARKKYDEQIDKVKDIDKEVRRGMSFAEMMKIEIHLFSNISNKDIVAFINNLYILKKAKFNNIQALKSLYETTDNPAFRDIIEHILEGVENGERLYTMMLNYPKVFPPMVVNFIRVGEETGTLDNALLYARDYIESSNDFRKKVRAAIIPKLVQFFAIIILMFVALIWGVPLLKDVYAMFNSEKAIPVATQVALDVVDWLAAHWGYIVTALVLLFTAFEVYIHTARGRYNWDKFKFKFPVVGQLLINMTVSNFFQAMLLNIKNGMRINEAISVSKNVTSNYYFLSIVEVAKNRSLAGDSWIVPFQERKIFNPMVSEMLTIGMQTDLPEMMDKVNSYIDIQIEESIGKFTRWLPDVTYAVVGVALIVFVLVVLVPVIEIYMGSFIQY